MENSIYVKSKTSQICWSISKLAWIKSIIHRDGYICQDQEILAENLAFEIAKLLDEGGEFCVIGKGTLKEAKEKGFSF